MPVPVWLAMLGGGVLVLMLTSRRRTPKIYARRDTGTRFARALWRAATGAHMDGKLRTDAGWWERGKVDLTPNKKAPRWAYLPRGVRALIRWGSAAGLALWLWGYASAPSITGAVTLVGLAVLVGLIGRNTYRRVKSSRFEARYVLPIHEALAKRVGIEPGTKAAEWVHVPPDFRTNPRAVVMLVVPPQFTGSPQLRQEINTTVAGRLGVNLYDLDIEYNLGSATPHITFGMATAADPRFRVVVDEDQAAGADQPTRRQKGA
ncbi:hypothetical protein [Amycolatopsis thermoflava]|uniref:hypothetical protein n=1 Tax=Amycolatopsis thermoflava TaxID=84480 RepID=UPI0012FC941D|nr:hypothetical protein [Amycolatopsis thermoflava]